MQCLLKEPLGGGCIPPGGEQKIDAGAGGVHRTVQIGPFAFDADVRFVDTPALVRRFEVWPKTSVDLGRVALNPSPDGYVIDG